MKHLGKNPPKRKKVYRKYSLKPLVKHMGIGCFEDAFKMTEYFIKKI